MYFVGQVMKEMKGKADVAKVTELIKKKLVWKKRLQKKK
jgi:Asp-tRNA(Asn)/Glu-tRNA(Gln) amidotransferase B subunit